MSDLDAFRARREHWLDLLHGDGEHSISQQLDNAQWQAMTYRFINEARCFGPSAALAPLLGMYFDNAFYEMQITAIGRLLDVHKPRHRYGPVSLRRVVNEVAAEKELFTREAYVSFDGTPYDPAPLRARFHAETRETPGFAPVGLRDCEWRHKLFDALWGSSAGARSHDDRVSDSVFDRLQAALAMSDADIAALETLRDKWIAHAEDSKTRPPSAPEFSIARVEAVHKRLVQVAKIVSSTLLHSDHPVGLRPVAALNQFELLDQPFLKAEHFPDLEQFYRVMERERENWFRDANADVLAI